VTVHLNYGNETMYKGNKRWYSTFLMQEKKVLCYNRISVPLY